MKPANYQYLSEFARRYVDEGMQRGMLKGAQKGKADLLIKQLTLKFRALSDTEKALFYSLQPADLDAIGERILTAQSLIEAIG